MDDNQAAVQVLVPIVGSLIIFGGPIAAFIIFRFLAHRERIEMIRHGMAPPLRGTGLRQQPQSPFPSQPGAVPGALLADEQVAAQVALRKGINLSFVGAALTIGLSFIGFHAHSDHQFVLGPWLVGGLVPLFVGLAQVTNALIAGATLGNLGSRYRGVPNPSATPWTAAPGPGYADPFAGATPGRPATYEDSYTYRPGDTQELRRPVPPPERKP